MPPEFDLSDPDAVAFCPSCGSGYTARATRCEPCDTALIPRAQVEAAARDAEEGEEAVTAVLLCRVDDPAKADRLAGELERAGIPFWSGEAPLPLPGLAVPAVEFRVPADHVDEARDILRRIEEFEPGRPTEDARE